MKFKYRVYANNGFISKPMDYVDAMNYSLLLTNLGNINVYVRLYDHNNSDHEQRERVLSDLLGILIEVTQRPNALEGFERSVRRNRESTRVSSSI
ncbi:hypothetical protein BVG16_23235 [Paenibacillus selenitireducens]|uniref:Uncharacterized protein n=1 Tax=Paenibacillus selenitireducens TaxID=1324314 RepID=A0A1T2X4D0_9BACL|nr:hypothetical protein [Paenibacillus selenitireducens]OPA74675.1 hypothetical protein BVG16_23235 [Paenibacillus selenitireducens]